MTMAGNAKKKNYNMKYMNYGKISQDVRPPLGHKNAVIVTSRRGNY